MTDAFRHEDPYGVLGLARGASPAEITRAYRLRARSWHPDVRPGDPEAAARFRALSDAYETLTDPARRAEYEREEQHERMHSLSPPVRRSPFATPAGWGRYASAGEPPLRAGPVWIEPDPPGDDGAAW